MTLLTSKTALITGGTSGIGLATAKRFIEEGAYVFIFARNQENLDSVVAELGTQAVGVQGDVTRPTDVDRLYQTIQASGRKLDILFVNAGALERMLIGHLTAEHVSRLININFVSAVDTVQKALPLLADGASIILNASQQASRGAEGLGIYAATKAALRAFARTAANELSERGIRVNAVSASSTDTPGLDSIAEIAMPGAGYAFKELLGSRVPLGRIAQPVDVANAVVFLASDLSNFTTGSELLVDGGTNSI